MVARRKSDGTATQEVKLLNLIFYSDQIFPACSAIDRRLAELLKARGTGNRLAYVASGPEPDRSFFQSGQAYYGRYDLDLALFYDLDEPHSAEDMAALFACDAIHLAGGHTGGFLERLKRSGMIGPLRHWALSGGLLIGVSAGSILMAPTIATDALFIGQKPEDIEDGDALGLVPFEFFPHLGDEATYLPDLLRYSNHTPRPIIACSDADGVVVTSGRIACVGDPVWIFRGALQSPEDIELGGFSIEQP